MSISWWKTGVMLPDMGGTIHTQSAGQPPRQRYSFSMCLMKDSVAEWWSTMVTLSLCGWREGEVGRSEERAGSELPPLPHRAASPWGAPGHGFRQCQVRPCVSPSSLLNKPRRKSPMGTNVPSTPLLPRFPSPPPLFLVRERNLDLVRLRQLCCYSLCLFKFTIRFCLWQLILALH